MSEVHPQPHVEMLQQELRFTAHDPVLDEALALLEKDGQPDVATLPQHLFLFAMKLIAIDQSDTFDGISQNYSTYLQYRKKVEDISSRGTKHLKLAPWMKPLYTNQEEPQLAGVGLRVLVDSTNTETLIAPPLYGAKHYTAPITPDQRAEADADNELLQRARTSGFIPVRYELKHPVEEPDESLQRLNDVLAMGAYVSHMTLVSPRPRNARENIIFHNEPFIRTYTRTATQSESELVTPIEIPLDTNTTLENAS